MQGQWIAQACNPSEILVATQHLNQLRVLHHMESHVLHFVHAPLLDFLPNFFPVHSKYKHLDQGVRGLINNWRIIYNTHTIVISMS
jgi:hypothetical protein